MSRTVLIKDDGDGKPIPPDPGVNKIPVRIDKRTVILVREGADIRKKIEKYRSHEYENNSAISWSW